MGRHKVKPEDRAWDYVPESRLKKQAAAKRKAERQQKQAAKEAAYDKKHEYRSYTTNMKSDWNEVMKGKRPYFYMYSIVGTDRRGNEVVRTVAGSYRQMRRVRAAIYKERHIWIKFRYTKTKEYKTRINR